MRIGWLLFQRQQRIEPLERGRGVLIAEDDLQHVLQRCDHKPQIPQHREHLPDGKRREKHHQHRRGTEKLEPAEKQQARNLPRRFALPAKLCRSLFNRFRILDHTLDITPFLVVGTDLHEKVQRFRQPVLEPFDLLILSPFELSDPAAEKGRQCHHRRIEQQDDKRELPVDKQQYRRHPDQRKD